VQQRPAGVVNGHLWEFPNIEIPITAKQLPNDIVFSATAKPAFTIRHTITRYRIQMDVYTGTVKTTAPGKWVSQAELKKLALSSAHRQIADRISRTSA
jgi:adenine-specific DNA glycosylase